MKKVALSLAFVILTIVSFSVAHAVNFDLTFKNLVEDEEIRVKTLRIHNGQVSELSHQEGDTIEFGDSFVIKASIKDRKDLNAIEYREELEKSGKTDIIIIGNEERELIIKPISTIQGAEAIVIGGAKYFSTKMIKWAGMIDLFNYGMELELFKR